MNEEDKAGDSSQALGVTHIKPDNTIGPRQEDTTQAAPAQSAEHPITEAHEAAQADTTPLAAQIHDEQNFAPIGDQPQPVAHPHSGGESITWTASEYIAHHKSGGWYMSLAAGAIVLAALAYLVTQDKITTGAIVLVAIIFGVYASREPRVLNYRLDNGGLGIGQKIYGYDLFRSFSVVSEGAFSSVALMPLKRFMPLISIYYDPKDEEKIIGILADRLPMEKHSHDPIDKFIAKIRF